MILLSGASATVFHVSQLIKQLPSSLCDPVTGAGDKFQREQDAAWEMTEQAEAGGGEAAPRGLSSDVLSQMA